MRKMPATLSDDSSTDQTTSFGSGSMALLKMGNGHRRPVTRGHGKCKILAGADRLFHEVDRGQAESTNKILIRNIKKKLEELPGVLWEYRTTLKTSMGKTPFSLVYRDEALIPVEIGEPSIRYTQTTKKSNSEAMAVGLELLEERREMTFVRMIA
ncbi:uncharacterized protein LOC132613244 [Lycium barbarum]|uniref:uncharacterized protein LOC132613244 n=1 Tax=Lycium barbarum TaxID=112863 RepID=UPI00293E89E5|nr:uncharacterized protein LOC132613244 [Lycium barbarum]